MIDYYKILGVGFGASNDEIRKAYKRRAFEYHPDRNGGDKYFTEKFKEIQAAYDVLKNSILKEEYDKQYSFLLNNFISILDNIITLPEEALPNYVSGFSEVTIRQNNKKLSELYCKNKIVDRATYKSWAFSQFYYFHTFSPKFQKWEDEIVYFRESIGKDEIDILINPAFINAPYEREEFINIYLNELVDRDVDNRTRDQFEYIWSFLPKEKTRDDANILILEYINIVERYVSYMDNANKNNKMNNTIIYKSVSELKSVIDTKGIHRIDKDNVWQLISLMLLLPIKNHETDENIEKILITLKSDSSINKIENIIISTSVIEQLLSVCSFTQNNLKMISYLVRQFNKYVEDDINAKNQIGNLNSIYLTFVDRYIKDLDSRDKDNIDNFMRNTVFLSYLENDIFSDVVTIKEGIKKIDETRLKSDKRCFVATACYGDYNSIEVIALRDLRDKILKKFLLGRVFIAIYYIISPTIATLIDKSDFLKYVIRNFLLNKIIDIYYRKSQK